MRSVRTYSNWSLKGNFNCYNIQQYTIQQSYYFSQSKYWFKKTNSPNNAFTVWRSSDGSIQYINYIKHKSITSHILSECREKNSINFLVVFHWWTRLRNDFANWMICCSVSQKDSSNFSSASSLNPHMHTWLFRRWIRASHRGQRHSSFSSESYCFVFLNPGKRLQTVYINF